MRIFALAAITFLSPLTAAATADTANGGWQLERSAASPGRPSPVSIGSGATAGMVGNSAVYIRRIILDDDKEAIYDRRQGRNPFATLERKFPFEAWRGKQVRLTLRLKNEGHAVGQAMVRLDKSNDTGTIVLVQRNEPGKAWQTHQTVLAVPDNANFLAIDIRLRLTGTVWVDSVGLEEVGKEVPLTRSVRADYACAAEEPIPCDPSEGSRRLYMSWLSSLSH